ncbi:hotdog domain-containing protein [Bacillus sp. 1P02SD]|uniref:hotdog domain-containing protein n=1 Tax=Bacillus sp. 1P02SD TaxID=3132264 RepID=UPI00399F6132
MDLKVGDIIRFERTFTKEDVDLFTKVSMDEGDHHTNPDELGRVVVQGLLTATLPTKVGGDYNVLARTMNFEFFRPVFTGDTIRCEVTIEKLEWKDNNRISIMATFLCMNQKEKQVLSGNFAGVIVA